MKRCLPSAFAFNSSARDLLLRIDAKMTCWAKGEYFKIIYSLSFLSFLSISFLLMESFA
jgi:hypothetical protein